VTLTSSELGIKTKKNLLHFPIQSKYLKIWFDILTPKQLLFFEPMITRLKKDHTVICTSRKYREVTHLAKIRRLKVIVAGRHGGAERHGKLNASISRLSSLARIIKEKSPDVLISFCSPEAARIAFGFNIKHVAFQDSPHAEAVMRLTIPLVQKLLIPWVIPKKEFVRFGIDEKNIISYKAIDAAVIAKRKISNSYTSLNNRKNTILIRVEEEQAAYSSKNSRIISIIKEISEEFTDSDIVALGRYSSQIRFLKKRFGKKVTILSKVVDGKKLLNACNVFVGSGGTMTAEAALLGIPTISYNAVPNFIEKYLVLKKLVVRENSPKRIVLVIKKFLKSTNKETKLKAKKTLMQMEDPYQKLVKAINCL
jgi:predicted glycosyltransferase